MSTPLNCNYYKRLSQRLALPQRLSLKTQMIIEKMLDHCEPQRSKKFCQQIEIRFGTPIAMITLEDRQSCIDG